MKKESRMKAIKENLTLDQIDTYLCNALGSDGYKTDSNGNHIFQTVCHGGDSYKLYYYPESYSFHCYTHCGESFDIFDLTLRAKHYATLKEAYRYLCNFFNIDGNSFAEEEVPELTDDWDILNNILDFAKAEKKVSEEFGGETKTFPPNTIDFFLKGHYPKEWLSDGISIEAMEKYNIRMDIANKKVIIPHYNDQNELIGIRGRAFNPYEIANRGKYAPIYIEGKMYNHELGKNLYGLNVVKSNLIRTGKVCIAESEKACMQSYNMFGDDNFTVATCGSAGLSSTQINLLLKYGVREVILAYDKEFISGNDAMKLNYEAKLRRILQPLSTLFDVSYLIDEEKIMEYKQRPLDIPK